MPIHQSAVVAPASGFARSPKILPLADIVRLCGSRPRSRTAALVAGVFDIVHPGHIRHLQYVRQKAGIVVAAVTCDRHVGKGPYRPHVPEELRAMNLAALECVDYVLIDPEPTPLATIRALEPEFFCKGTDYSDLPPRTREEAEAVESYGGELLFTPGDVVYSSSRILEAGSPKLALEKLQLVMERDGWDFARLRGLMTGWLGRKVLVVGDTIVDRRTHCELIGSGAKTPTLSIREDQHQDFIGGAAIVALHLAAAGADVSLATILGNDLLAEWVLTGLRGIEVLPTADATRPTTHKNTFVCRGHALLKVDKVDNHPISHKALEHLISAIRTTDAGTVIFSDFRHGVFNIGTVAALRNAIPRDCYRVADSQVASRWGNVLEFPGFDLITPNEREARFALGEQETGIRGVISRLFEAAQCKACIMKLGEHGLIACRAEHGEPDSHIILESFARDVVDPVGAGDALLAYAALSEDVAAGSILGSIAAAIECERDGNIPVTAAEVRERLGRIEHAFS